MPRELKRALLVEAGHRCVISTCRAIPVELAHIVPWAKVREHTFENMIVLCPNCHARLDRGEIDRLSMLECKDRLRRSHRSGVEEKVRSECMRLLEVCGAFQTVIGIWWREIHSVPIFRLEFEGGEGVEEVSSTYVQELRCRAEEDRSLLKDFIHGGSTDVAREAEWVIDEMRQWADTAVEGIWPSSRIDAYACCEDDVERALSALESCVYGKRETTEKDFPIQTAGEETDLRN